jgi:hypothetical protein
MRSRFAALLAAAAAGSIMVLTTACGYMGEPLPPALLRPTVVTDLAAVEHGSKIVIHFTLPTETTEALPVKGKQDIELRVGPYKPGSFQTEEWLRTSDRVPDVPQTPPTTEVRVDAAKYVGRSVVVMMRERGPKGRDAGWSNAVDVTVVPPLEQPTGLEAKDAPDAVDLTWKGSAGAFRVFRRTPDNSTWILLGIAMKPEWLDTTIDYGKLYQYFVQAVQKTGATYAESEESDPIPFKPYDKFPPAAPAGLSAIAGSQTIELVWDRSTEKDFAGYRVYRDGTKVADNLTSASFSDRTAKQGVTYRYEVTAFDGVGNESGKSMAVESAIP